VARHHGARRERGDYPLARAYAFDAMLREPTFCTGRADAYEISAEAYLAAGDPDAAQRELAQGPQCDGSYEPARARALAVLARRGRRLPETEALEKRVAEGNPSWTAGQKLFMDAVRGNLLLGSSPADGEALLRTTLDAARPLQANSDAKAALEWSELSLGLQAARRGDGSAVMDLFSREAGLPDGRCTVVVGVDHERNMTVVEDGSGSLSVRYEDAAKRAVPTPAELFPGSAASPLRACPEVRVVASAPIHGTAGLLPSDLAWAYRVRASHAPDAAPMPPRALVVSNVDAPAELGLPPLQGFPRDRQASGIATSWLRGPQATVGNVLRELRTATEVQIDTHGLVDIGESDAPLLVLTPDASGVWSLSANDVAGTHLDGHPVVILGACNSARAASSLHEQWSLPAAFVRAGARSVIAASEAIPDGPAADFFEAVLQRIRAGASPAVALRDERMQWRGKPGGGWVDTLLLFE
jgi:hypothetical protein